MKKIFVTMLSILLLMFSEKIEAQVLSAGPPLNVLCPPVRPYKFNGGYTLEEARAFAKGDGELNKNWTKLFLQVLTEGLTACGKPSDAAYMNIDTIFNHITYEVRTLPAKSMNTRRYDEVKLQTYLASEAYTGLVAVFRYQGCEVILFKAVCMNNVKVLVTPSGNGSTTTTFTTPAGVINLTVINNNTNNNTATATNYPQENAVRYEYEQPQKERVTFWDRLGQVGAHVGFNFSSGNNGYYQPYNPPQQVIETRTMASGIPANNVITQPGLDAQRRSMPNSIH